ncbi:VPS4-associated protein 1 [Lipomyces arxii]|uniref:VPS4-associated protein 1 n=1 Tax=Lipomyces arxii TaxID=56418 RepID=UPI0034CF205B
MASVSSVPFKNVYHLRRVAEISQKPCTTCYKPTTVVLVSEDGKSDFFYTCQAHLNDKGFASPMVNAAAEAAKARKVALEAEMAKVKKEWEEHLKNKKTAREKRAKEKAKDEKAKKDDDEDDRAEDKREKLEHKEQVEKLQDKTAREEEAAEKEQRIYILNKDIYSIRVNNWRNVQRAKRNAELLRKVGLPSVPTGDPSASPEEPK